MAHYTSKAYEYVLLNATHLQLDPILDYARAIARIAGPGSTIYKDVFKTINTLGYAGWINLKASELWFGLVDQLPYAERVITKEVRKMNATFMSTIVDHGLMDYHLSPPATYQDELPGELLMMMMFNPATEKAKDNAIMNNVNIEVFDSAFAER